MALCSYCGKVEIAWAQVGGKWEAREALRDTGGAVIKVAVKNGGGRTVMRAQPGETKHYPHGDCPAWTPEGARTSLLKGRGRRGGPLRARPVTVDGGFPPPPLRGGSSRLGGFAGTMDGETIPSAAPIGTATIETHAAAPIAEPRETGTLPEPESLLPAGVVAAWKRADAAIRCTVEALRVLLWGPPGTGKTELPFRIAQAEGWHHVYQLMTEETPATELLGHLIVQAGNTVWCDGTLGRAIRLSHEKPTVFVVDEIARASQDAASACLLALTNPESLRLVLRSGEILAPKVENWHVVVTSNDDPATFTGALADRLHIAVRVDGPHPDLVRSMTTVEARRLATAASREYSVRALLTYDRLRAKGMSLNEAAGIVWEPSVARSLKDAIRLERGK